MHIEPKQPDLAKWLGDTMEELKPKIWTFTTECPHCRRLILHPLVAKQQDLDLFQTVLNSAFAVMQRHGITAALLKEIRAEAHTQIAIQNAQRQAHDPGSNS